MSDYKTPGEFDGQKVFFGPDTITPGGMADTKQKHDQIPSSKTVWLTNTKGIDMTIPMALETAKYLVNRKGNKFQYAKEDEIPFTPEKHVVPFDSGKKIEAQESANVELTGSEVEELTKQGIDPLEGVVTYVEMRKIAKANNIKVFGKKKKQLAAELRDKGLIG